MLLEKSRRLNGLISSHPGGGGGEPRTYAGMARNLSTMFANFNPGMGGLDRFCTFVAGEARGIYIFLYIDRFHCHATKN